MNRRLEIAAAASILLHLGALAWVGGVLRGRAPPPDTPDTRPMIELRLVEQQGAGDPAAGAAPQAAPAAIRAATPAAAPEPAPPEPAPRPSRANPPPVPPNTSGVEVPAPRAATPAMPPTREEKDAAEIALADPQPPAPAPVAALEMNLGGTDSESNALASGPGVIPAGLDQRARNRPPVYPEEAARRGQQGAVVLLIHVSPDGVATSSDVLETSGFESLDQAAQRAVMSWRFRPGLKDGRPVASGMPMRFVFEFN